MKKRQLTPIMRRQVELLSKYYPLSKETNTFFVQLYYEKVSDILYNDISDFDHPRVNDEQLSRVKDILDNIPVGYTADLSFSFGDYEGYNPKAVIDGINDALELNHYRLVKENKLKLFLSVILVLVGFSILSVITIIDINQLFSDENTASIVREVMDISAWVFIWQAVTVLFLSPSDYAKIGSSFARKVNKISMYKEGNKEVLVEETKEELFANWVDDHKARRFGRYCLLFSGAAILADAVVTAVSEIPAAIGQLFTEGMTQEFIVFQSFIIVVEVLMVVSMFITGITSLFRYHESHRMQKMAIPCLILMILVFTAQIGLLILGGGVSSSGWLSFGVTTLASAAYIVGYFLTPYRKIKEEE